MNSMLLHPSGNLSAIHPTYVSVKPITAANVAVGDVVRFDISASDTTYTSIDKIEDFDDPKCPFNVVILGASATTLKEGGVWGIVTEAATAGSRCTVCIHGVVTANVFSVSGAAVAKGDILASIAGADLGRAVDSGNPAVAIALGEGTSNATVAMKVFFNGYQMSGGPSV
jgi:hypothetical protein